MTKTVLMMITLISGTMIFAQNRNTSGGTTFGLRGGVNFQNINGKDFNNNTLKNKILTGFHGGINAEIPVGSGFYIQPGVLYSMKGTKGRDDSKTKLNYIEVPVNFIYKPALGTGNLLLGFGPYAAFGIGGELEYPTGVKTDVDFGADFNGTNAAAAYKRFDAGANLLAGYEFNSRFSFQLNAQLGLVNINKENPVITNDQTRWRNTGWGVSLGYRF
jgi:hypothetical protein